MYIAVSSIRASGGGCDGGFVGGDAADLERVPELRCSARLHSLDMNDRDFFDTVNPDGIEPSQRMTQAGFSHSLAGEIVATGDSASAIAQDIFFAGGADCEILTNPEFSAIGVGKVGDLWTLDFARP
jgi:uncharacterized protein YkwD